MVTVTRLAEGYKNLEVVLRAVAVLVADGTVEHLTIVGDGPRRAALQTRIDQLGLGHRVTLAGRLDDDEMSDVLAASDVGVFASRNSPAEGGFEGFGIVIHELAAAGLPVVVANAAGATDAAHPEWANLVEPDDVRAWVEAIDGLAHNIEHRLAQAAAAAEFGRTLSTAATAQAYVAALRGRPVPVRVS